jgi:hypothetical protein
MTVYIVRNYCGGTTRFRDKWQAIFASHSYGNEPYIETLRGKRPVIHLIGGYELGEFGETYEELKERMLCHYELAE